MKFALESAKDINAKVVLGGMELDQNSLDAFKTHASLNPVTLMMNSYKALQNSFWHKYSYLILINLIR